MDTNSEVVFSTNGKLDKIIEPEPALRYDHLSLEVIEGIRNAFQIFDLDGDGKITATELGEVINSLLIPQTATHDEVQRMIHEADSDGSGTVEFEDFFRLMHCFMAEQDPDREIAEAFHLFDHDQNGYIDREELKEMMKRLGEPVSEGDIDAMMRSADLNSDGKIDFDEFKNIMNQRTRESSVSSGVSHASYSSNAFESTSASGSASPQPQSVSPVHPAKLALAAGKQSQRAVLSSGVSMDSSAQLDAAKRRRSSKQLTKSQSTTETMRPSDLLTVSGTGAGAGTGTGGPGDRQRRRPSWTAFRHFLKKH